MFAETWVEIPPLPAWAGGRDIDLLAGRERVRKLRQSVEEASILVEHRNFDSADLELSGAAMFILEYAVQHVEPLETRQNVVQRLIDQVNSLASGADLYRRIVAYGGDEDAEEATPSHLINGSEEDDKSFQNELIAKYLKEEQAAKTAEDKKQRETPTAAEIERIAEQDMEDAAVFLADGKKDEVPIEAVP
jgi:hypothetical protein